MEAYHFSVSNLRRLQIIKLHENRLTGSVSPQLFAVDSVCYPNYIIPCTCFRLDFTATSQVCDASWLQDVHQWLATFCYDNVNLLENFFSHFFINRQEHGFDHERRNFIVHQWPRWKIHTHIEHAVPLWTKNQLSQVLTIMSTKFRRPEPATFNFSESAISPTTMNSSTIGFSPKLERNVQPSWTRVLLEGISSLRK